MTRIGILLAAGILACCSVSRADEGLNAAPPATQPAVHPSVPHESAPCCDSVGCCGKGRRLLEWLTYRPLPHPGGCCKQPACCRWPLYTWFLDYCVCQPGCGGYGGHPAGGVPDAPCSHGPR